MITDQFCVRETISSFCSCNEHLWSTCYGHVVFRLWVTQMGEDLVPTELSGWGGGRMWRRGSPAASVPRGSDVPTPGQREGQVIAHSMGGRQVALDSLVLGAPAPQPGNSCGHGGFCSREGTLGLGKPHFSRPATSLSAHSCPRRHRVAFLSVSRPSFALQEDTVSNFI